MGTNINITVGGNGLLQQLNTQQQAARQAYLEEEARKNAIRDVEIQRITELAARGLDSQGKSLGRRSERDFWRDQPAASRFGEPPDDPYKDWPGDYPRPTDEIWPDDLTPNPDQDNGDSYVAPILPGPSWQLGSNKPGFKTIVTIGPVTSAGGVKYPGADQCSVGESFTFSESVNEFTDKGVVGAFREYGYRDPVCGNYTSYKTWLVFSDNTFTAPWGWNAGRRDPWGWVFNAPDVTVTQVPI